ncbi:MAG: shikimate kinase [Chitinophagales bacterium]
MINQKLEQNIYLIGFMAAGKSSIGKKLAEALTFRFVDLDDWLEKEEKQTISSIFSEKGEAFFRKREQYYLQKTANLERYVIATGGGTPCYFDNMENIKHSGLSFYLRNSPEFLAQRLMNEKAKRPLVNNFENISNLTFFVEKKLKEREKFYQQADFTIHCLDKNIKNIVDEILSFFKTI